MTKKFTIKFSTDFNSFNESENKETTVDMNITEYIFKTDNYWLRLKYIIAIKINALFSNIIMKRILPTGNAGGMKNRFIITSAEWGAFEDFAISDIRGDICEKNGKVFIITASGIYCVENGGTTCIISDEIMLTEKAAVIDTDRYSFILC